MAREPFDFGYRLKELRMKKKLTQKEVASKIGVDKNTISKYENNTGTPSLEKLIDLAVLYSTSLDYIVNLPNRKSLFIDDLSDEFQEMADEYIGILRKYDNKNQ